MIIIGHYCHIVSVIIRTMKLPHCGSTIYIEMNWFPSISMSWTTFSCHPHSDLLTGIHVPIIRWICWFQWTRIYCLYLCTFWLLMTTGDLCIRTLFRRIILLSRYYGWSLLQKPTSNSSPPNSISSLLTDYYLSIDGFHIVIVLYDNSLTFNETFHYILLQSSNIHLFKETDVIQFEWMGIIIITWIAVIHVHVVVDKGWCSWIITPNECHSMRKGLMRLKSHYFIMGQRYINSQTPIWWTPYS